MSIYKTKRMTKVHYYLQQKFCQGE